MILNTTPDNQAILSNVGEIGEFRIRNSAKAFNILSSGLYANKIKAIVRELSCNAVDSHTAAGKSDVPFEVHLPNALEPHFSIRDFGTGLSHEQVTNIYTTYFESTKTASNDFIGALGLGSKSPFSYTDNFTVTAIKDGRKGIYSAFINAEGVPSIALMMEEQTDDPAGVEIKFSVNDRYDYNKFRDEARSVYRYFKLKPVIRGCSEFRFDLIQYETENLIAGVHVLADRHGRNTSRAVMGNIAYPIEVPNAEQLGGLQSMLQCGLEIHFGIGEVDFQASREGLSYIPQTVEAIKNKLTAVRDALSVRVKADAEAIPNLWDRAIFLSKKIDHPLWTAAVQQYAVDTKLQTVDPNAGRYAFLKRFKITVEDLKTKYNIDIRAFSRSRGSPTCSNLKHGSDHSRNAQGGHMTVAYWEFPVSDNSDFVVNDTKVGVGERAKYHYRQKDLLTYSKNVYILDKADPTKDMELKQFFADIASPPSDRVMIASDLLQKPRKDSSIGRNVSLLRMETRSRGYRSDTVVWADAGSLSSFDANTTHYYIPLSGYNMVSDAGITDAKELREWMKRCGLRNLVTTEFYGVRKTDLEAVKAQPNWVNIEDYIASSIGIPDDNLLMNLARDQVTVFSFLCGRYGDPVKFDHSLVQDGSPFKNYIKKFDGYKRVDFSDYALRQLYSAYGKKINFDLNAAVKAIVGEYTSVCSRYPLLDSIGEAKASAVAEYVNLIDNVKGI